MAPLLAQRPRTDRAFERLYRRHVADVYHYALAVLRNPADAEDVTQTTFLNAYRAYERGERPQSPQNWLITIAHNVCRQRFRQTARRPREVAFDEDLAESFVDEDVPSATDIRRALGHLAFNQRAALVMRELEGRRYDEIGEILGISVSAVETLIFRARRALREQLDGSLTCRDAELAISRQLDGRLPRGEHGVLRAHLRECRDCARFARSQRAQRAALRSIGAIPLPASLASFFGGGGSAVSAGLVTKAAVAVAAVAVVGGVGYEGASRMQVGGSSATSGARILNSSSVVRSEPAALAPTSDGANGTRAAGGEAAGGRARAASSRHEPANSGASKSRGAENGHRGKSVAKGAGARSSTGRLPPGQAKARSKRKTHNPRGAARGRFRQHENGPDGGQGSRGNGSAADAKPARGNATEHSSTPGAHAVRPPAPPKPSRALPKVSVPKVPGAGKAKSK